MNIFYLLSIMYRSATTKLSMGKIIKYETQHEISNNVVKSSDPPMHMRRLIRAFTGRLNLL